ncbi:alpha-L-fucosidase [Filimonas lacunae]|uniref:Alpha-L-fucosidase n=1 Tax=Filimonas lacunae TaxID=477680 RepID=A0A173MN09_9BACT|nr:sialidase family protein [Filimonas lacunae]BAV08781.1 hypothetical protein FLA_4828 [Filimonas lacunae]SIS61630.1 alpha-L-fucosidase [Filimonas lacunae]
MNRIIWVMLCLGWCWKAQAQTVPGATAQALVNEVIVDKPPYAASHASTIEALPGKRLIAAWFAGPYESSPEVCVWTAIYQNGKWQAPKQVADGIINDTLRYPCWNPVLFRSQTGRLFLYYKIGKNPREWWGMVRYSDNNGQSWSAAQKLPSGMLGPIKNKPVQLANGTILHPSSTESLDEKEWHIHVEQTDKNGNHWKKVAIYCDTFGVIQPSILIHGKDSLQMLCRSRQNRIVQTWSTNNGASWEPLTVTELPNPNSGSDAVTLCNGSYALVYNPLLKGKDWYNGRNRLYLATSPDGIHWNDVYVLENEKDGEFSYPAIIQTPDGLLHITYTWNRRNIKHVVVKL